MGHSSRAARLVTKLWELSLFADWALLFPLLWCGQHVVCVCVRRAHAQLCVAM